ncbi:hypothetical protein [Pantoea agglomerans]|uniref:hypothetical protein n=1 Tax=Enterobacter agglomerans TaxID=549 RepID=UPI00104F70B3|nr:hypothetical protein [Pantoea agglomerans]TCZ27781.1 hypothetical protein EYB39_09150 [Pantoea agglomerans]
MDNQKPAAIASYQCGLFANHGQMSGIKHGGLLANLRNVAAINWLAADQRARLAGQQTAAQAPGYRSSTEPRYSLLSQSISALIFCHVPTMLLLTWLIFSVSACQTVITALPSPILSTCTPW